MSAFFICGKLWTVWWLSWVALAFATKKTLQRESLASRLSYTVFGLAAVWILFFGRHLRGLLLETAVLPGWPWIGWLGVGITVLGLAVTYWARWMLGRNWSGNVTIKVDHELIRTGPYRLVRHPIYTGLMVAAAGTAMALNQWRGVVAFVLLWMSFTLKRLKEEEFMHQIFGSQYDEYARTTGAIFPKLLRRNP
jgi:protein-S-isoprenylcysteine O-methyltransferase Ste14